MSEPLSCTEPTADDRITSDGGKAGVKFRLQLVVVNASGHEHVQEVARIERDEVAMETPNGQKNPIYMKSKDDGRRGPGGPDRGVTTRYITKKSPRNVGMVPYKTARQYLVFSARLSFLDHTRSRPQGSG